MTDRRALNGSDPLRLPGFVVRLAAHGALMVANSANVAAPLLDGMLARFTGEAVRLDLHDAGFLEPWVLADRGLSKRRSLTRMRHGLPSDAGTAPTICASAGPEYG